MSNIPEDLEYTEEHEWVRDDGDGTLTVGITDYAQEALGDLVFVELPKVGRRVESAEACAVIESVKAASDVYSPLTGEVTATNSLLEDTPETISEDPYGAGWLFKLRPSDPAQLGNLLDAASYRTFITETD